MFDFLKKKLKDAKDKIVEVVKKKEVKEEPVLEKHTPEMPTMEEIQEKIEIIEERLPETIEVKPEIEEVKETKRKKEKKIKETESMKIREERPDIKEVIEEVKETVETPKQVVNDIVTLEKEIEVVKRPEIIEVKKEKPSKLSLTQKFKRAFSSEVDLTVQDIDPILQDLQMGLLESDVAYDVTERICSDLKLALTGSGVKKTDIDTFIEEKLKDSILSLFTESGSMDLLEKVKEFKKNKEPLLIAFIGTNGSGKTTSLAKIAQYLKKNGYSSVLAAGDTFRAASIEQLEEHGRRLEIPVIKHTYGSDAAAVIFDAVSHAKARGIDVVLADTAGRSHTNTNLMDELNKVIRVNKPHLKILVVDSLTGNEAVEQAVDFNKAVSIDAVVVTKTDVNPKGGAALSVSYMLKRPILFMGLGQEYKDLKPFEAKSFVDNLFS